MTIRTIIEIPDPILKQVSAPVESFDDDLKTLVGNVQRNEILRAMVRYSVHTEERNGQTPVSARDRAGPSAPAGGTDSTPAPESAPAPAPSPSSSSNDTVGGSDAPAR